MTRRLQRLFSALAGLAVTAASARAGAQVDVNPPLPNIMLLVDTSASMEYKSGGSDLPICDPTGTDSERSRWIDAVEVLTGTISDYRCQTVNRSSAAFRTEYALGTLPPPDYQSLMDYHRPLSGTCTPGPGVLPSPNAFDYPAGAIRYHDYTNLNTPCTTFSQANDGILDNFLTLIRFGLMTFDTRADAGTGYSGTSPDYTSGIAGTWSYFVGSPKSGHPAGCSTLSNQEVGARNAAAPPWEGRMVAFGDPNASTALTTTKNQQIQEILLATRPYDATPTAGMLDDARTFFWYDTSSDPLNPTLKFGPSTDQFVMGGCRPEAIILLTDGEPNLDLRRHPGDGIDVSKTCEGAGPPAGICPYDKPEDIAFSLANPTGGNKPVKTYVVGFALDTVTVNNTTVDCKTLTDADLTAAGGLCLQNPDNKALQACCSLNRIAFSGGTSRAVFASDKSNLRTALADILSRQVNVTNRTVPVFTPAGAAQGSITNKAASYRFFSSFQPLSNGGLWDGVLDRQRVVCQTDQNTGQITPTKQNISGPDGDHFVDNVNSGRGPARNFVSVLGDSSNGVHSDRSIRPQLVSDDGLGLYTGTQYSGTNTAFVAATTAASMGLTDGSCGVGLTADQCRDLILQWDVGLTNAAGLTRCKSPGSDCHLVGDIYHSTPQLVNRPLNVIRDEAYQNFAADKQLRPLVLYTSTNDGFLHAFQVASNDPANPMALSDDNNELWAFIPPAVLPSIQSEYPPTHANLLDGMPVTLDVVARPSGNGYVFDRTLASARNGLGTYRTALVQGFGRLRSGYFALDVTDPVVGQTTGPTFLWQLTTDSAGAPLFGASGATPLITTISYDVGGGDVREVPVAVLPGGAGASPTGAACSRAQTSFPTIDSAYAPRTSVNCYSSTNIASRSLTIARLDTGEVVRTFRRSAAEAPAGLVNRVTVANIDSPITGEPAAFPGGIGVVADRIYVGDADGGVWKVDLRSTNPADWTMNLFFDAFPSGSLGSAFNAGQPIVTPVIVSVDDLGNPVLAVSTGDQEIFSGGSATNYVWSLSEKPNASGTGLETKINWYITLTGGERVAGPMELFGGNLFFSTFTPSTTSSACTVGQSKIWGVDYKKSVLLDANGNNDPSSGPKPTPLDPTSPTLPNIDVTKIIYGTSPPAGTPPPTVFGVGIEQVPTCSAVDTTFSDPVFGYGTHTSITNINPGKFQLVFETGSSGTQESGGLTHVGTIDLPTPPMISSIDSWAAVIE